MPTYDYECLECNKPHRAEHSMNADKPDCPSCGGQLKQVFLMAPAVNGAQGGSDLSDTGGENCDTGNCATGTCPFMQQ